MGESRAIKATCEGKLFDGLVDCYVLEDGRRVVSQTGVIRALRGSTPESARAKDGDLGRYLSRLPCEFAVESIAPIEFSLPRGGSGLGLDAESFVAIIKAYKRAWRAGALHHAQVHLAERADELLDALAGVGIAALIDEATGFQASRKQGALADLFAKFFRPKPMPWEEMFTARLVSALCKLDRIAWNGGSHPRHLASTNAKIYQTILGSDVWGELKRRNPEAYHGSNNHQHLSDEARASFRDQLVIVECIANQSVSKDDFWRRMDRQYGNGMLQIDLIPEPS